MSKTRRFLPLIKPSVGSEELEQIKGVLESGWLAQGPKVVEFEKKLAQYLDARFVIATSSCTTALSLALDILEIPSGSEVIVPDFTFPATANIVVRAADEPVISDIRVDDYSLDVSEFKKGITKRTSAVIPVHPFGHAAAINEINEVADKAGVKVIEDAATAIGTRYKGKRVGSQSLVACFSFHPRKLLTTAEGGCIATNDEEIAEKARALRSHGQVNADGHTKFLYNGLNYRLSDVHAAIGIAQLGKIDYLIESRRKQAKIYNELLESSRMHVHLPVETEYSYDTYQSYVIRLGDRFGRDRDSCIQVLKNQYGIETQVGTYSLHLQPAFSKSRKIGKLENGALLYDKTLSLPLFESLSEEEQKYVVDSLNEIGKQNS
ncbi:MAG: DegT/DnrJ/EryC1/StrS family aminotransferase [Thaumarchaeota archaeon]|nr:DegT/DnrJ/EryC1/StrS family aminotransferase [Nitrososphaerota archaeon]